MKISYLLFYLFLYASWERGDFLLRKNLNVRVKAGNSNDKRFSEQINRETFIGKTVVLKKGICLFEGDSLNWEAFSYPKLDFEECYYSVLEVPVDVDFAVLKKAYHRLVFQYHADRKTSEREKMISNRQMQVINAAYTILRNSVTRRLYDERRQRGFYGRSAQIKLSETNPADTRERATSSYSSKPFQQSFSSGNESELQESDMERMKSNVQEVWNTYIKGKHSSWSSSFPSNQGSIRSAVETVTAAAEAVREVSQRQGKKQRESRQLEVEKEYEEEENDNQEIYSTLTRLRSLPYNKVAVKNGLLFLYRLKERKIAQLNRDQRDWGDVSVGDELLVEQRLRSINALRAIHSLIGEMEEKLRVIARCFSEVYEESDEWDDLWEAQDDMGSYYSNRYNRDGYPPNQPRPQPQPQR